MQTWKIGSLAKATGLTVRTLHHYHQVGLLSPSQRTAAGHRVYGEADVARLQQIVSLRSLGFGLEDIRAVLAGSELSPLRILELHASRLRDRIRTQQRLADRLDAVAAGLRTAGHVSADQLIHAIEEITTVDKYFTPEQQEQLASRREQIGDERIREVEAAWPRLIAEVEAEMERGTDPADPAVQALAKRWMGLVQEFTGGDPGIFRSAGQMWQNESRVGPFDAGHMRELIAYISRANAAGASA